jgi:hypothetical protein
MSQGLQQVIQNASIPSNAGFQINILDELGLNRQQKVFQSRTMALTKPADYASARDKRFAAMAHAVEDVYDSTMKGLERSGLPRHQVQQLAVQASASAYATQNAIFETDFPSGSTELNVQTAAKDAFPGMVSAPSARAPRRAPRKRATKKKK